MIYTLPFPLNYTFRFFYIFYGILTIFPSTIISLEIELVILTLILIIE